MRIRARVSATVRAAVAMRGSQNFLGAAWVAALVDHTPAGRRRGVALWLLALSPHYFYGPDRYQEAARNRATRERLAAELVGAHLADGDTVLDYGCGPGYLAVAAAARTRGDVWAVDISAGVLACARILNSAPNLRYQTPAEFAHSGATVDVAYSVAVAQHLTDAVLRGVLRELFAALRPGGVLVLHVVVDAPGWHDEREWRRAAASSVRGWLRMRYGLNCFSRSPAQVTGLLAEAGFAEVTIRPVRELCDVDDDVAGQHVVVGRRPERTVREQGVAQRRGLDPGGDVRSRRESQPSSSSK
ncbi:MAG: class I SAM-dependent methyltransferase [Frankia sp.]